MEDIQLDMFEVQLGAAILLQFRTSDKKVIRVLADAGVTARGYSSDHVHKKIPDACKSFDSTSTNHDLDLIVGTHYDADHLEGFIPIINDITIGISEAWMPPVVNDTEIRPIDQSVKEQHLLAYQFAQEDGFNRLEKYLNVKKKICDELKQLGNEAENFEVINKPYKPSNVNEENNNLSFSEFKYEDNKNNSLDDLLGYFYQHLDGANSYLKDADCCHASEEYDPDNENETNYLDFNIRYFYSAERYSTFNRFKNFQNRWEKFGVSENDLLSFSYIRRSAAKDAINAGSLYKVVDALKKRKVPISWHMIKTGSPRRFVWDAKENRFNPNNQNNKNDPEFLLLGPSEWLVKKHQHRLPLGQYLTFLTEKLIPIKQITPSNQLSYVMRFAFKEQGILICGDAGFVDFKSDEDGYHQELTKHLIPLNVIQVAHHGGNNAHFYRVLLAADFAQQKDPSLLLLSHATHDKFRPSKEFGLFIEQVRRKGDDLQLLFTSEPTLSKVKDFKSIIHPPVGVTSPSKVGDIRVVFDSKIWSVKNHSIQIL